MERSRSAAIDGLRAAAALSVLAFHVALVADRFGGPGGAIVAHGNFGVPVFFALSGLLLYRPFVAARWADAPAPAAARFALRRAARIVPAYWLTLLVLGALGWADVFGADWWRFAFFLQAYD